MSDTTEKTPPTEPAPASVYDYLAAAIQQMAHICWVKLGTQRDAVSGKFDKNFGEAKVAIDAVAALAKLLEPQLDESDQRQLQSLLRDLRINFVQKSSEGGALTGHEGAG
jgi:hypothetical protein